jgi:hypothetical protein
MDEAHQKALTIFSPYYLEKALRVEKEGLKFIQYTSADAAMSIIRNGEVWLRNSQCMNDYSEVEHGLNCLTTAFRSEEKGKAFQAILEKIFPGIVAEFIPIFESWLPSFRFSTFIACVSEHPPEENLYGRLSMWRAYGGNRPIALVLNKAPFLSDTDIFHAYTNPVAYLDPDNFSEEFHQLSLRMLADIEFIKSLGKQSVINYLFDTFKNIVLCVKHPGFMEEREWRVVYNPDHKSSEYVSTSIETINGIPQEIHKIPLKDIPEGNFYGASIPEFIDKVIIGPSDQQAVLGRTFAKLLENAGCDNPHSKIHYSGIPLR